MRFFLTTTILISWSLLTHGQSEKKQELAVNAAGVFVKNQATIAPSFFYRYQMDNYQLRLQFAFDSRVTNDDREGLLIQKQTNFSSSRDTTIDYEPSKNNALGFMLGIQNNSELSNSNFNYFYGVDFIYMLKESSKKGKGNSNLSQSTIVQNTTLSSEVKNKIKTIGLGLPMGISYYWDSRYFVCLEAKFVIAYQTSTIENFNESILTQQNQTTALTTKGKTTSYGFDIGLKPITGLCFGIQF